MIYIDIIIIFEIQIVTSSNKLSSQSMQYMIFYVQSPLFSYSAACFKFNGLNQGDISVIFEKLLTDFRSSLMVILSG